MKTSSQLLSFIVFFSCSFYTLGQIPVKSTTEIEVQNKGTKFQVFNLFRDGLVVLSETWSEFSGNNTFHFYKYDTDLNLEFSEEIVGYWDEQVLRPYYNKKGFYFLLTHTDKYQMRHDKFRLFAFDFESQKIEIHKIPDFELQEKQKVNQTKFCVVGKRVYMIGYAYRKIGFEGNTVIQSFDLDNKIVFNYHIDNSIVNCKRNEPRSIFYNLESKELEIRVRAIKEGLDDDVIIRLNFDCEYIDDFKLGGSISNFQTSASAKHFSQVSNKTSCAYITCLKPTEAERNMTINLSGNSSDARKASGLLFVRTENGKTDFEKSIGFSELESFNLLKIHQYDNYEPAMKLNEQERKAIDSSLHFNCRIFTHELIAHGDNYIFVGEIYDELNGEAYGPNDVLSTIGFEHNYGVVICLNQNGEVIWDYILPLHIRDRIYKMDFFTPREKLHILVDDASDKVKLIYNMEESLFTYSVDNSGKLSEEETQILNLPFNANDKVKKSNANISTWYDNYFFSYGYADFKDAETKDKKKILYLQKYEYNF